MIAAIALSACLSIPEPGEGYVSSNCGVFDTTPLIGEWVPAEFVHVDTLCIQNERYIVNGVPTFAHWDGAPPCQPAPTVIIDPPHYDAPPPTIPTAVPEPSEVGMLAVGLIAAMAWRRRR